MSSVIRFRRVNSSANSIISIRYNEIILIVTEHQVNAPRPKRIYFYQKSYIEFTIFAYLIRVLRFLRRLKPKVVFSSTVICIENSLYSINSRENVMLFFVEAKTRKCQKNISLNWKPRQK